MCDQEGPSALGGAVLFASCTIPQIVAAYVKGGAPAVDALKFYTDHHRAAVNAMVDEAELPEEPAASEALVVDTSASFDVVLHNGRPPRSPPSPFRKPTLQRASSLPLSAKPPNGSESDSPPLCVSEATFPSVDLPAGE
jgi:hypothetical protein